MVDYGLIGAFGQGLQSYNDASSSAKDRDIKKRLARAQEIEAAAKMADVTGEVPSDLYKTPGLSSNDAGGTPNQNIGLVGHSDPSSDLSNQGLLVASADDQSSPSGLLGAYKQSQSGDKNTSADSGSEFLTKPIATQFMPKHVREGVKEAATLSASAYGKGVIYKYDPETRSIQSFSAPRSEEHDLELQSKREAVNKAREESQNVKPEQGQAALFGKRMQDAEQVFSALENSGYNRGSVSEGMKSSLLPGAFQGPELKRQDQAERNFVNAVLRRESGAAIAQSEFDNAEKQYFPRAGDPPEVLDQKRQNRQLAINAMQQQAGKKAWSGLVSPSLRNSGSAGLMGGKVTVSNGKEKLSIDASDLPSAQKDGYQVIK